MNTFEHRSNAIKQLHYRHGIGDIKNIQFFADGRIEITTQGYGMRVRVRRGRIVSHDNGTQTIKLYRHQITAYFLNF